MPARWLRCWTAARRGSSGESLGDAERGEEDFSMFQTELLEAFVVLSLRNYLLCISFWILHNQTFT